MMYMYMYEPGLKFWKEISMRFNTKEIAEYLNISLGQIRKLVRLNRIPYYKIETKLLFDKTDIDNWLQTKKFN